MRPVVIGWLIFDLILFTVGATLMVVGVVVGADSPVTYWGYALTAIAFSGAIQVVYTQKD